MWEEAGKAIEVSFYKISSDNELPIVKEILSNPVGTWVSEDIPGLEIEITSTGGGFNANINASSSLEIDQSTQLMLKMGGAAAAGAAFGSLIMGPKEYPYPQGQLKIPGASQQDVKNIAFGGCESYGKKTDKVDIQNLIYCRTWRIADYLNRPINSNETEDRFLVLRKLSEAEKNKMLEVAKETKKPKMQSVIQCMTDIHHPVNHLNVLWKIRMVWPK